MQTAMMGTAGDALKNLELSLRRAQAVGALLVAEGIDPELDEVRSLARSLRADPSQLVYQPKSAGVEVPP